jgi:HK97 family phage major capsid protein
MEIKDMTIEQLEERKTAIAAEIDAPEADLDALEEEARNIKAELETRKAEEAKKAEIRSTVAKGEGTVMQKFETAPAAKTDEEIRSSAEYCEAWKNYIINNDPTECRSLLTTNASGGVPVPTILEEGIKTAWENDDIMSRVRRTYVRGNLKVAFELSADPAYVHTEGTTAPTEEALTFGVVELIPANVKKWIKISDEVVALAGPEFVQYVRDELTYQIVKKEASLAVTDITTAGTSNSSSAIGVPKITAAPSVTVIPTAAANLSDQASNLVVIMNRLTEVEFLSAFAAGNFAIDPFAGIPRVYTSALPAYSTASAGDVYAIVGDLSAEQFNFPEGDGIVIKYDDVTLAEADMVKITGRRYAAHKITRPGRLCNIAKPSAQTT